MSSASRMKGALTLNQISLKNSTLNSIVKTSVLEASILGNKVIYLPTGDGLCVVLMNIEALEDFPSPYDIHLRLALDILSRIDDTNSTVEDQQRKIAVRIGLNEGTDNLVTDINSRLNVAGDGINTAQRVMGLADGNQILVGTHVYNTLRVREKYMRGSFRILPVAEIKHAQFIQTFQFIQEGHRGLNIDTPKRFVVEETLSPKLTKTAAYYIAYAASLETWVKEKLPDNSISELTILLYAYAEESYRNSRRPLMALRDWGPRKFGETLELQLATLGKVDSWLKFNLERFITDHILSDHAECFVPDSTVSIVPVLITEAGKEKLKNEWPDVWDEVVKSTPN
jgi:Adenylate and Guanylate cyclase catalytic domain